MGSFFSREYFSDGAFQRPPLCCGGGAQALNWSERLDGYLEAVQESPINVKARRGQNYAVAQTTLEDRIIPVEATDTPWPNGQVVWMDQTADGGLPHTRPPYYVCLPTSIDLTTSAGKTTLRHERIHVSQRLHELAWEKIYKEAWNFVRIIAPELPEKVKRRIRINPDTFHAPLYAYTIGDSQWIPYALFNSSFEPALSDVTIYWWHIQSSNLYNAPPPGWVEFFGGVGASAYEHPHELAAYILTSTSSNRARTELEKHIGDLPRNETW